MRGLLRVTLAPTLATHLLMPDFADFARLHPDIEMEILSSGDLANLTNREADVAIRVVYDRKTLPLNLHGLKGPELFGGVYMSCDRLAAWRAGAPDPIRWIVISIHGIPDWASEGEVRTTAVPFRTTDAEAQIVAVRRGLGMTTLPCFVGDADPLLVRVPGANLHMYGTVWLLTQGQTRKTKRVRLFTEFVSRRLAAYAASRGTVRIARLTRGRSSATLAVIRSEAELRSLQATSRSIHDWCTGIARGARATLRTDACLAIADGLLGQAGDAAFAEDSEENRPIDIDSL